MLLDLVKQSRSFRGYDPSVPLPPETLRELVECARLTPSTRNPQPRKFVSVSTPETVGSLQKLTHWAGRLPQLHLPHEGKHPSAFLVICLDTRIAENPAPFQRDVGITAQTILLAAAEKGFGGCMIGSFDAGKAAQLLELPSYLAPQLVVALGKPDETIVLTHPGAEGDVGYYRDENDVHYVPKRPLEEIYIEK